MKNNNMKSAIVDQFMLGIFVLAGLILFMATSNDEVAAQDKALDLKTLTKTASLAAAKYYTFENEDIPESQNIANGILSTMNLGVALVDDGTDSTSSGNSTTFSGLEGNSLTYTWDLISNPQTVTVTIAPYREDTFWYRFAGLASFTLNATSTAKIVSDEPENTGGIAPFGVGGCDADGNQINFIPSDLNLPLTFRGADGYIADSKEETNKFFALEGELAEVHGNSAFAHFKNQFKKFFDVIDGELVDIETADGETYWGDMAVGDPLTIPDVQEIGHESDVDTNQLNNTFRQVGLVSGTSMWVAVIKCQKDDDGNVVKDPSSVEVLTHLKLQLTADPDHTRTEDADGYQPLKLNVNVLDTKKVVSDN